MKEKANREREKQGDQGEEGRTNNKERRGKKLRNEEEEK